MFKKNVQELISFPTAQLVYLSGLLRRVANVSYQFIQKNNNN